MSAADLDALEAAALARLAQFINRMTSQHIRRMREGWRAGA